MAVASALERAKEPTPCQRCQLTIGPGELVMSVRNPDKSRSFFHPDCFLTIAKEALDEPKGKAGRKPLPLTDEQRDKRNKLLRQYAANKSRINEYSRRIKAGDERAYYLKARLIWNQMLIKSQIEPLGGVPDGWKLSELTPEQQAQAEANAEKLLEALESARDS